nr:MAG TPA: Lysozyme [Ackermannviridae sp.]DAW82244.1 MAG TPA: Lysozyme [Bacteriophage sp.]
MKKIIFICMLVCSCITFGIEDKEHFEIIVNQLFEFEGRNLVKAEDGYSKFGLTKYYTDDVKNLTENKAKEIIYSKIYNKYELHRINNLATKHLIFDFIYNTNPYRAIKVIKKICKNYDEEINLENYSLSDRVISVINNNPQVFEELVQARLEYIRSLKLYKKYGNGWEKRINWFQNEYKDYIIELKIKQKYMDIMREIREVVKVSLEQN